MGWGQHTNIHTTYGRTLRLLDQIGLVGRFGEKGDLHPELVLIICVQILKPHNSILWKLGLETFQPQFFKP